METRKLPHRPENDQRVLAGVVVPIPVAGQECTECDHADGEEQVQPVISIIDRHEVRCRVLWPGCFLLP